MKLWDELSQDLKRRESIDLRRFLRSIPAGGLDLASNDYLGLAVHPEVVAAAGQAAATYGAGARASRLVSGHFPLAEELESALAKFKNCEAALVFSSGYAANMGVISALTHSGTALFCHKRNHASLIDGCRFAVQLGASLRFFEKTEKLRDLLAKSNATRKIIVLDGVFSMDGDVCDLPATLQLAQEFDVLILLDDAHGTGTLGATGRGTCEYFGLHDQRIVQLGTLSKALGSQGGFVAGPQVLIDYLVNTSRSFIYSTGLNPPAVGAAFMSLQLIEQEPQLLQKCRSNATFLAEKLSELGWNISLQPSPILPIILPSEKKSLQVSERLSLADLWCPAIRPPTVPTARLRLTANANWNWSTLNRIVAGFGLAN